MHFADVVCVSIHNASKIHAGKFISLIETSSTKAMTLHRNASGSESFLSDDVPLPFGFCNKIIGMCESLGTTVMSLHRAL